MKMEIIKYEKDNLTEEYCIKMGHIHGEKLAYLPLPIEIRKELIASGKALPQIIYPESMWVSRMVTDNREVKPVRK